MHIHSKSVVIFSPILALGVAAGLVGYRFGAASTPTVMARKQPAAQPLTTSRDS